MRSTVLIAAILALILSACTESVDTEDPTLTITAQSPQPIAAEVCGAVEPVVYDLLSTDTLRVSLALTDDEALSQLKVDIHTNFDCHGHAGTTGSGLTAPDTDGSTGDWSVLDLIDLGGREDRVDLDLIPPANATAGTYHFQVQAVDAAGNEASPGYYSIRLHNADDTIAPTVTVTAPVGGTQSWARGETVAIAGTVSDDRSFDLGGNAVVYLARLDLSSGNLFFEDWGGPLTGGTSASFNEEFTVPSTIQTGSYRFVVGATDGVRNLAESTVFDVTVTD